MKNKNSLNIYQYIKSYINNKHALDDLLIDKLIHEIIKNRKNIKNNILTAESYSALTYEVKAIMIEVDGYLAGLEGVE